MRNGILLLLGAASLVAALPVRAQARKISLRTLCFQHAAGLREVLLVSGTRENPVTTPVKLFTSAYSDEVEATITGPKLVFAIEARGADGQPRLRTVAEGPLAAGARQVAVFIPSGQPKVPYRLTVIDETEARFPMGSTLIYNMTGTTARFTIGENEKQLKDGEIGLLPLPKNVNDLNQTTVRVFLTDKAGTWLPISSTVWQTSPKLRGLALASIHPQTRQPVVHCLQETPPWRLPKL